jgi:hypothetical protein
MMTGDLVRLSRLLIEGGLLIDMSVFLFFGYEDLPALHPNLKVKR